MFGKVMPMLQPRCATPSPPPSLPGGPDQLQDAISEWVETFTERVDDVVSDADEVCAQGCADEV
eukprot:353416-Chlamydomonas_euryale.AAC.1